MDISFIILSYNQKNNIIKIINSIIYAHLQYSYELIIVDNLSTDNTITTLTQYCTARNLIFKILENPLPKNQSYSRNLGLKTAIGTYIYYIDGDDYLNSFYLNKIKLQKTVEFVPRIMDDHLKYKINTNNIEKNVLYPTPVQAFYQREFLLKNKIFHEENTFYYYSEDLVFSCLLFDTIIKNNVEYNYQNLGFIYFGIKRNTSTNFKEVSLDYYVDMYNYILPKLQTKIAINFLERKIQELMIELGG